MIDLENETMLTLGEASKRLPGRPHLSTLARWARGMKDGRRLRTVKIGGRVFTSIESLQEFVASKDSRAVASEVSAARRRMLEEIDRRLDKECL